MQCNGMRITLAVWPFGRACARYHLHRRTINNAPHHTRRPTEPATPLQGPLHRLAYPHQPGRRYETRPAAFGGLGDASVTPVGRRPKTRSFMAGGRGALGIRRLDVIDPNRPRDPPLTVIVAADSGVRACVHVWQPLTARHHTAIGYQRFSLPSSDQLGRRCRFYDDGSRPSVHRTTVVSWGNIVGRISVPVLADGASPVRPPADHQGSEPNSSGSQTPER